MLAVRHHSVPDLKVRDATSRDHDPSDVAVTEGERLIQLIHDRLKCRQKPVRFDLVEHHADLVRLLAGLCDPTGLSKFHQHALGADRDECSRRADEKLPRPNGGAWDFGDFGGAGF